MTIEAPNEMALMQEFLRQIIQRRESAGEAVGESAGVIGFRAIAADLAGLLVAVLEAVDGEASAQGFAIRDIDVAGLMPIEDGLRCWGFIDVADGRRAAAPHAIAPDAMLHAKPVVRREGNTLIADIVLAGEGEWQ